MKTFTLHLPVDADAGDPDALENAVLVKDGFSWGAFFFSVLWFLAHRLWLAGLMALAGLIALGTLLAVLRVGPGTNFLALALFGLLVGLEANSLRRWTLARRGRPTVDVIAAVNQQAAETKAFERWLSGLGRPPTGGHALSSSAARPLPPDAFRSREPVIGLFPEAERAR